MRRVAKSVARALVRVVAAILILIGVAISALETGWGKNRLRDLIVSQANRYLTATLTIGRLQGSLFRGLQLGDVQLVFEGRPLVTIDEVALSYSIRELVEGGTIVRAIRLTRPHFTLSRLPDGRWDITSIVKRERREEQRTGPGRPVVIQFVQIDDGRVLLRDPLVFGAAHVPSDFQKLDARFAFAYYPVRWRLDFERVSWTAPSPELSMNRLSGALGNGPGGWFFENLSIATPQSALKVGGNVVRGDRPTELDLVVNAQRFVFQEWAGVLPGLRNIAVDGSFDVTLKGPLTKLETDLKLAGSGGSVDGHISLDTTVPGWHGAGAVDVARINLARWLNSPPRVSDITGHVTFDLALQLGRRFPRGVYSFDGAHAMYMEYAADNVKARGQITETAALVAHATATAYGADVVATDGSIGIDTPFPYRFQGTVTRIDLRNVPKTVPVPRVESLLTFEYDVAGTFSNPFIIGRASFAPSTFLGARIGAGTTGSIDTSTRPLQYGGEGDVSNIDLGRFGRGLEVGWLQDPRYAGTITGRFYVNGTGSDTATLTLEGGGRLIHGSVFKGTLSNADVSVNISAGTLRATYAGAIANIDPSIPFADARWQASLTGSGSVTATVRDLLVRKVALDDYLVDGSIALERSTVRGVDLERAHARATLRDSVLSFTELDSSGAPIEGHGSGTLAFAEGQSSSLEYDISSADLAPLKPWTGWDATGIVATKGRLTGPWNAMRVEGDASIADLDAFGTKAVSMTARYDITVPGDETAAAKGQVTGDSTFVTVFGQSVRQVSGIITLDRDKLDLDLRVQQTETRQGTIAGSMRLRLDSRAVDVSQLTIGLGRAPWRLQNPQPATIAWTDEAISISPSVFTGSTEDERITVAGDWRTDGQGTLKVTASHVFLDTLQAAFDRPTRYGGVLDAEATIRGTRDLPSVAASVTVTNGRVERVSYQKLAGRVDYSSRIFTIDLRLDQSPGIWITAAGTVPLAVFDLSLPERPIDVALKSSGINLGLIEGVTDLIRHVSGDLIVDLRVTGTSHDPHFVGALGLDRAAFQVVPSGVEYKNGRVGLTLAQDRVSIDAFRIEDQSGRTLELRGSLATHELQVGELEVEVTSRRFTVLRNELGRLEIDTALQLRGRFERPLVTGTITVNSGQLRVDEILQRTVFQPYATEQTTITEVDAVAALNPWQRLGLNLTLHVPNTLRMIGDNVQVSPGTPIGLGDINLRTEGDLYLYKDPGDRLYVTGSFYSISGTYRFQGRPFNVDSASSIVFRGDLNPELYVGVTRTISAVQTRVGLIGPMREPELRLSSIPPLDESDILSLIVFNTSTNELSAGQQQELVARAGALAAGFLATPILSAVSREIGLDVLEVETVNEYSGTLGTRVTIGEEIAPGLIAKFSRQFGAEPYDEATIEYYLSRILRLRATFSDAQSLNSRSPFRRVERAGIDLLFFFSF